MNTWTTKTTPVEDSHMFHREMGSGDPWVFVHGMPVSSHVWVPLIERCGDVGRCLAPDLIGMGASGKPDIAYSVFDHVQYLNAWFDAMDLHNITLVVHGWGSLPALAYARENPERIQKIVLFEAHIRPTESWDTMALPVQQLDYLMKRQSLLEQEVLENNFFIETFLQEAFLGDLSEEDQQIYQAPFQTRESRKVLLQYARELSLGTSPSEVHDLIQENSDYLMQSSVPKCLLYAIPGFLTTVATVQWAKVHLPNLVCADLGHGFHFAQSSNPDAFASSLMAWSAMLARKKEVDAAHLA